MDRATLRRGSRVRLRPARQPAGACRERRGAVLKTLRLPPRQRWQSANPRRPKAGRQGSNPKQAGRRSERRRPRVSLLTSSPTGAPVGDEVTRLLLLWLADVRKAKTTSESPHVVSYKPGAADPRPQSTLAHDTPPITRTRPPSLPSRLPGSLDRFMLTP